jgi:hypothetical protein
MGLPAGALAWLDAMSLGRGVGTIAVSLSLLSSSAVEGLRTGAARVAWCAARGLVIT